MRYNKIVITKPVAPRRRQPSPLSGHITKEYIMTNSNSTVSNAANLQFDREQGVTRQIIKPFIHDVVKPFIHIDENPQSADLTLQEAPIPVPQMSVAQMSAPVPVAQMSAPVPVAQMSAPVPQMSAPLPPMPDLSAPEPPMPPVKMQFAEAKGILATLKANAAERLPADPTGERQQLQAPPPSLEKVKVNPSQLMRGFAEKFGAIIVNGELYIRAGRHYESKSKHAAKQMIAAYCRSVIGDDISVRIISEVLGLLMTFADIANESFEIDDNLVDTLDGVIDVRTGQFVEYSPFMRCFHYLPYHVSPAYVGAQHCPNFSCYLYTCTGGEAALIERLWELVALLLTPKRLKCLPILFGAPSSGKSVLLSLLKKLMAPGDCFPLNFTRLCDRFSLGFAATANLITYYDVPNERLKQKEVAALKSICSTEDDLPVERKGGEVKAMRLSKLKVILASNFILRGTNYDEALNERIKYFVFPFTVPKEARIEHLSDLLASEGSAIISTCLLQYAPEMIRRNLRFSGELETQTLIDGMVTYVPDDETSAVIDFICECVENAPDEKVSTAELFEAFIAFCSGAMEFTSDRKFSEVFAKTIGQRAEKCRLLVNGKSVNGYRGIRLKPQTSKEIIK